MFYKCLFKYIYQNDIKRMGSFMAQSNSRVPLPNLIEIFFHNSFIVLIKF